MFWSGFDGEKTLSEGSWGKKREVGNEKPWKLEDLPLSIGIKKLCLWPFALSSCPVIRSLDPSIDSSCPLTRHLTLNDNGLIIMIGRFSWVLF